jgi:hypothetical protein
MKNFILLVFGFCAIFIYLHILSACDCISYGTPIQELNKAVVVFIGEVIDIQRDSVRDLTYNFFYPVYRVKFSVLGYWKGISTAKYELFTMPHIVACGYPFEFDSIYIVYGYNRDENIFTSSCDRTNLLIYADKDLAALGPPIISGVQGKDDMVQHFELHQNFPNPFNPITSINYELSKRSAVDLKIYNMLGQEVTTLVSEEKEAGKYSVRFNASGFASGVYFYRLQAESFVDRKKLILIR